jgi:hypothetical protein
LSEWVSEWVGCGVWGCGGVERKRLCLMNQPLLKWLLHTENKPNCEWVSEWVCKWVNERRQELYDVWMCECNVWLVVTLPAAGTNKAYTTTSFSSVKRWNELIMGTTITMWGWHIAI